MNFFIQQEKNSKSKNFNSLENLEKNEFVDLCSAKFYDSPQIISICQTNARFVSVFSWDRFLRVFVIQQHGIDMVQEIFIDNFARDMIYISLNQILLSTSENELISINFVNQQTRSSSTPQNIFEQYQIQILLSNIQIRKMFFYQDKKILSLIESSDLLSFYVYNDNLKHAKTYNFEQRISDIQQDIDELFVLLGDGTFYIFELKYCSNLCFEQMPKFSTQIEYFEHLNSYDSDNRMLVIGNVQGKFEMIKFNDWQAINEQQITERIQFKIEFKYSEEIVTSIRLLFYTDTMCMVLTNHGFIQVIDLETKEVIINHYLNYRVVCEATEDNGKWMMVGFGYDWVDGVDGTQYVNYKPCIAFFNTEELVPFDQINFDDCSEDDIN